VSAVSTDTVVVVQTELLAAPVGSEELVILQVDTGRYYSLSAVGMEVWELVQQPRRVGEIVENITSIYDVERTRCEADVVALLQDMARNQLILVREDGTR